MRLAALTVIVFSITLQKGLGSATPSNLLCPLLSACLEPILHAHNVQALLKLCSVCLTYPQSIENNDLTDLARPNPRNLEAAEGGPEH